MGFPSCTRRFLIRVPITIRVSITIRIPVTAVHTANADNVRYVRLDQHIAVRNDTATQRCSTLRGCALRCTALVLGPLSFDALLFHTLAQTHRGQFIDRSTGGLARRGAADLDIILVLKGLFHLMPQ